MVEPRLDFQLLNLFGIQKVMPYWALGLIMGTLNAANSVVMIRAQEACHSFLQANAELVASAIADFRRYSD
jgi:hypothetical protein